MTKLSFSNIHETKEFAKSLARKLKGGEVIFLVGELGAGKTYFVKTLAENLGITKRVKSPTFVLFQKYEGESLNLYHFDLYRLKDQIKEKSVNIEEIGLSEAMSDPNGVVVIEWADLLDEDEITPYLLLKFIIKGEEEREVEISGPGEKIIF